MTPIKLISALFLSLSITSAAMAYIVPGDRNGGGQDDNSRPPRYVDPNGNSGGRDDRGGGWGQDNRQDHGGGWGHDDHQDHGGWGHGNHGGNYPSQPYYPPSQPYYPPSQPYYPPSDPYYPPSQPNYPPPPPAYNPGPNVAVETIFVGRSVMNERISLTNLSSLNSKYAGWSIVSVVASTQPNSPSTTTIRLAINDFVTATQINPGYQINLIPNTQLYLGGSNIEMWVNGSTYINTIQIQLQR
jgi:hypothetical protein